jgi:hypothetical protein
MSDDDNENHLDDPPWWVQAAIVVALVAMFVVVMLTMGCASKDATPCRYVPPPARKVAGQMCGAGKCAGLVYCPGLEPYTARECVK